MRGERHVGERITDTYLASLSQARWSLPPSSTDAHLQSRVRCCGLKADGRCSQSRSTYIPARGKGLPYTAAGVPQKLTRAFAAMEGVSAVSSAFP